MSVEITLPVLNEEECLPKNVPVILDFFKTHGLSDWSLVIVDNGSDDATPSIAQNLIQKYPTLVRYMRLEQRGVGLAIRESWGASQADIVGYMDIDLATDLSHLMDVKTAFGNPDIKVVNGSRFLKESRVRGRKAVRKLSSFILNKMMHLSLHNHFTDAMCGFKFFRRDLALALLQDVPPIPDWFVSAELLVRAEWAREHIHEIPVTWTDDPNSKAKIIKLAKQYTGHIYRLYQEKSAA